MTHTFQSDITWSTNMRQSYASNCCDMCKSAFQSQKAFSAYFISKQILPFAFPERCCCLFRVSGPALSLNPGSTCGWRLFVCRDHKDHTEQTVLHHLRSLVMKKQCIIPGKHDRVTLSRQIRHIYRSIQCLTNGGPTSWTVDQHWSNIG